MKIRIKFCKYGVMKFIGHLDMMRYFQKAMRRADIDIRYSEGYSPHQIMSFAAPLGVGITSDGEYLDIEVNSTKSSEESVNALNEVMVEGVKVLSYVSLPEQTRNAMSSVACADYVLYFKESYESPAETTQFMKLVKQNFTEAEHFMITKKTKKSEALIDLKELVYEFKVLAPEEFSVKNACERNEKAPAFYIRLSTGSEKNIKPELVLAAVFEKAGFSYDPYAVQIHRNNVYFRTEAGEYKPLDEAGELIE